MKSASEEIIIQKFSKKIKIVTLIAVYALLGIGPPAITFLLYNLDLGDDDFNLICGVTSGIAFAVMYLAFPISTVGIVYAAISILVVVIVLFSFLLQGLLHERLLDVRHRAENEGFDCSHGMAHSFFIAIKRIALYAALWFGLPVISIALYYFGFYDSFFNRVGITTSFGVFFMVTLVLPIFAICVVFAAILIPIVIVGLLSRFFPWLYSFGYVSADELKKDKVSKLTKKRGEE